MNHKLNKNPGEIPGFFYAYWLCKRLLDKELQHCVPVFHLNSYEIASPSQLAEMVAGDKVAGSCFYTQEFLPDHTIGIDNLNGKVPCPLVIYTQIKSVAHRVRIDARFAFSGCHFIRPAASHN